MTDPDAQHRAAMKKAEADAAALEKTRLTNLELTNPCLFDTELKFAITKLLHTNLYEKNNLYRNLFESENIKSWVEFWICTKQILYLFYRQVPLHGQGRKYGNRI